MVRREYLRDSCFLVYIDKKKFSFEKVSGIAAGYAKEIYNEGGIEEPHILKGIQEDLNTLRLEHGVSADSKKDEINEVLQPGNYLQNIEVIAVGKDKKPHKEFFIPMAVVTKVEIAGFDASDEKVLIESFELEYYQMSQLVL